MSNRNENLIPTAAQIKAHRQELGLSQVEYAARLGVSRSTVGHWESNRCSPSEAMTKQIMVLMDGGNINPQTVTIDWQALVGEHQGIKGVSLRHLMSLGLHSTYQRATEALDRAAIGFLADSLKTITTGSKTYTVYSSNRPTHDRDTP
jgi:DNA-binding XRE family transcriptional regulator